MNSDTTSAACPELAAGNQPPVYRFEIFKGSPRNDGRIMRARTLGWATLIEGGHTYRVKLKTLLNDTFYLMPETKRVGQNDFALLTREASYNPTRLYYWNNVGEGVLLTGQNHGLLRLTFDLFGNQDLYMNLQPVNGLEPHDEDEDDGGDQ